jgi:hypothetical protein
MSNYGWIGGGVLGGSPWKKLLTKCPIYYILLRKSAWNPELVNPFPAVKKIFFLIQELFSASSVLSPKQPQYVVSA